MAIVTAITATTKEENAQEEEEAAAEGTKVFRLDLCFLLTSTSCQLLLLAALCIVFFFLLYELHVKHGSGQWRSPK